MSRYTVGQELFVVYFEIIGSRVPELFIAPLIYQGDEVGKITIKKLTVIEHHKVPNHWDEKDIEPTCDGFILNDDVGNVLYNQYPRAEYGQISDSGDRMFNTGNYTHSGVICEYRLLTDFMKSLYEGFKNIAEDNFSELDTARKNLFDRVVKQLKEEHNQELDEVAIWKEHPDITRFVLKNIANPTGLIDGKIPPHANCPYKSQCEIAQNNTCHHLGESHKNSFSCASARGFEILK